MATSKDQVRKLLTQKFLMVSKSLIRGVGLEGAVWIADILSKYDYFEKREMLDKDGWFYNTQKDISESTGLSLFAQTKIVKDLKETGIIHVEKRGIPSKYYYKIDMDVLAEIIEKNHSQHLKPDTPENESLVTRNRVTSNAKSRHINKNKINKNKVITESFQDSVTNPEKRDLSNQDDLSSQTKQVLSKRKAIVSSKTNPKVKPKVKPNQVSFVEKPLNGLSIKIFSYWEMAGFKKPKATTKAHQTDLFVLRGLLDGSLFGEIYTPEDIIKAIDYLKQSTTADYTPTNINAKKYFKNIYFYNFVYNEIKGTSIFRNILENPPKLIKNIVLQTDDPDPEITNFLKNFYVEKILGGVNTEFSADDENCFRYATDMIKKFFVKNLGRYPTPWFSAGDVARLYTDAVMDYIERFHKGDTRRWKVFSFKWKDFFQKDLPAYMYNNAMIQKQPEIRPLSL